MNNGALVVKVNSFRDWRPPVAFPTVTASRDNGGNWVEFGSSLSRHVHTDDLDTRLDRRPLLFPRATSLQAAHGRGRQQGPSGCACSRRRAVRAYGLRMNPRLVQLGSFEISPDLLTEPGEALDTLLGRFGSPQVQAAEDDVVVGERWRVIDSSRDSGGTVVAAAPVASGFALLYLNHDHGRWIAQYDPLPVPVAPGKLERASHLELVLPANASWAQGQTPLVIATLHNYGERTFPDPGHGYDSLHAVGWLTAPGVEPGGSFAYNGSDGAGSVAPGESAQVAVHLITTDINDLPPGDYMLHAVLHSVGLFSAPSRVRIGGCT